MSESFVDITYRGLAVGRRVKLSQIRPTTGYLELPQPMPVGTAIDIASDEGLTAQAIVTEIHEQVGGSEHAPGMRIRPALDTDTARTWWETRVTEQEPPPPSAAPPRPKRASVAPAVPVPLDEGENTAVTQVPSERDAGDPQQVAAIADPPVVDDGKRTIAMSAIDLQALGLDSGAIPVATGDDVSGPTDASGPTEASKPNGNGGANNVKRRKRTRR